MPATILDDAAVLADLDWDLGAVGADVRIDKLDEWHNAGGEADSLFTYSGPRCKSGMTPECRG